MSQHHVLKLHIPPNVDVTNEKGVTNVVNNMLQIDVANRKMWEIEEDVTNVGNRMMETL